MMWWEGRAWALVDIKWGGSKIAKIQPRSQRKERGCDPLVRVSSLLVRPCCGFPSRLLLGPTQEWPCTYSPRLSTALTGSASNALAEGKGTEGEVSFTFPITWYSCLSLTPQHSPSFTFPITWYGCLSLHPSIHGTSYPKHPPPSVRPHVHQNRSSPALSHCSSPTASAQHLKLLSDRSDLATPYSPP